MSVLLVLLMSALIEYAPGKLSSIVRLNNFIVTLAGRVAALRVSLGEDHRFPDLAGTLICGVSLQDGRGRML